MSFDGVDLTPWRPPAEPLRKRMQIIFQDPYASLNPRMTVRHIIGEPLRMHGLRGRRPPSGANEVAYLRESRSDPRAVNRYPHEFSAGASANASASPGPWPSRRS